MATTTTTFTVMAGVLLTEDRGGTEILYTPDTLGNLIECRDTAGLKTYSAEYWPYGEIQTSTGTNTSPWGFVGVLGYYADIASILYVRARYLHISLGRWLTVDRLWPIEKAYTYVNGNPTSISDRSGLQGSGDSGPDDPCLNACLLQYYADLEKCTKDFDDCWKKFFWLPYYCMSKLIICLHKAPPKLDKCTQCCFDNFDDGAGPWINDCFGGNLPVNWVPYPEKLQKAPLQEAL